MPKKILMKSPTEPICLKIEEWRAASAREVIEWLSRDEKEKVRGSQIIVRARLRPIDVYCYLKARFGEPNGFQNFLRRDDSDNWIHWDYNLKIGNVDVYFAGTSREIHVMVGESLTDDQWRDLIVGIRSDYARLGKQKSAVLKSLEKYVVFQNKFISIANQCADLHAAIVDAPPRKVSRNVTPQERFDMKAYERAMKTTASETIELVENCLKLHLLMPIMAEAFINMIILMFSRDSIRNDEKVYQAFIRAKVPDRLALLNQNCDGFSRAVDRSTDAYAAFMRVIAKRNFALHGNVNPIEEQIEVVYFDGKRPLFYEPGNNVANFFEHIEAIHEPAQIVADYEAVHTFLVEIMDCLSPPTRSFFEQVIDDAYPGFEVNKKRVTRILPDRIMMGILPGMRYDDELKVEW